MLMTKGELKTIAKPIKAECTQQQKLELLRSTKGKLNIHEIDALLKENGFNLSLSSIRRTMREEKIPYIKISSSPKRKGKGRPITIGLASN